MKPNWSTIRIWLWRAAKIATLVVVGAGIVYWLRFAPVPVSVHTVGRGPIVAEVMGTGTLEARVAATISPKISGRVAEVLVDQGDRSSAGDLGGLQLAGHLEGVKSVSQ